MKPERPAEPPAHVEAGHGDQRTYSPRAIRPDGTYAGLAGGYGGPPHSEGPAAEAAMPGEGTYGYPYGVGVGDTGGRRPDDEAADLSNVPALVPEDPDPDPGPGDRFGAGRQRWWRSAPDPGGRDAELEAYRSEFAHGQHRDYRQWLRDRARVLREGVARWQSRRKGP
jgi:hypothetical protein